MDFLEKDLEGIIYENYFALGSKGLELFDQFHDSSRLYRQVNLGRYGIADLIYVEVTENIVGVAPDDSLKRTINVYVIECKLNLIDVNAYMQAKRYVTGLKEVADDSLTRNTDVNFFTVLIGSKIQENGDFVFALNDDHRCTAYTYSYGIDGIEFESHRGWTIRDSGIKGLHLKRQLLELFQEYAAYNHYRNGIYKHQNT